MNITIFETYTDVIHGNSKNIFLLGKGMDSKGHKISYLLSNEGKLSKFLSDKGLNIKIEKYPNNLSIFGREILKQNFLKTFLSLMRFNIRIFQDFKKLKPDIVHCTSTRSILSCAFASMLYGSKLIWVIQMEHSNRLLDLLATLLSSRIIFIARSLFDKKPLILQKLMQKKSVVIPIGIDLDADCQKMIYPPIKERSLKLICVASLVPNKGIHLLVDAMKTLTNNNHNVSCTFVGQKVPEHEEYLKDIKKQIFENKLTNRITFHGWTSDVKTLLLENDIFILPSISEGLSRAILEAMYVGIPIIAFDTGALSEVVDENVGNLMQKDDVNSISKAVEVYLNNENLIKIHGQEARKRVESKYTLEKYLESMNQFYESCLGSR